MIQLRKEEMMSPIDMLLEFARHQPGAFLVASSLVCLMCIGHVIGGDRI